MRAYRPLITRPGHAVRPLRRHDQNFDRLILPAAGALAWVSPNQIIAYYRTSVLTFAIVSAPETLLPLYVRSNGVRYRITTGTLDVEPEIYAVPYSGQTLYNGPVFEFWSADTPQEVTLPQYSLTISLRTEQCCCDDTITEHTATVYTPYCYAYPLCFPLCSP